MAEYHVPVLAEKAVDLLEIKPEGTYADLTFGGGGHSRIILSRLGSRGRLYGFDQDGDARANIPSDPRFTFVEGNFRFMRGYLRALRVDALDGVLADLGVSSHHFDSRDRGFSFRFDAPLDMRMNQRGKFTAQDVVNKYNAEQLTRVLGEWGEVETPWKAANCIVRSRERGGLVTVGDLVAAIAPCTPRQNPNKFLSKVFQALRIEVNREMEALKMMLEQSLKMLRPGGVMVVISYHSLEDRLVKNFFRTGNFSGEQEKDFYGQVNTPWETITRKAIAPTEEEIESNPRSRSAKMRAVRKL